jgi:hypothetical protein
MKRNLMIVIFLCILSTLGICLAWNWQRIHDFRGIPNPLQLLPALQASSAVHRVAPLKKQLVPVAPRFDPSEKRLAELEELGSVPYNASPKDWQLAQKASWWGKPVDTQVFWSNRVVWLDRKTRRDANAYGRTFPPIPFGADIQRIPKFSDEQDIQGLRSIDDSGPRFWGNAKEHAFWNQWVLEHPRPAVQIESKQIEVASSVLRARYDFEHGANLAKHTPASVRKHEERIKREAVESGYPPEAFMSDVLLTTYAKHKLDEYETLCIQGREKDGELSEAFKRTLFISQHDLLNPSVRKSDNNAWKVAYIKRLRDEGVDESYINAYQDEWNLKVK